MIGKVREGATNRINIMRVESRETQSLWLDLDGMKMTKEWIEMPAGGLERKGIDWVGGGEADERADEWREGEEVVCFVKNGLGSKGIGITKRLLVPSGDTVKKGKWKDGEREGEGSEDIPGTTGAQM